MRRVLAAPRARVAAVVVAAVAVAAVVLVTRGDGRAELEHRGAPAFTLRYAPAILRPEPAAAGEIARLAATGDADTTLTVRRIPPQTPAALPLYAERVAGDLRRRLPGFALRDEGHVDAAGAVAYRLRYRARGGVLGEVVMLVPPQPRGGPGVLVSARRTGAGERAAAAMREAREVVASLRFRTSAG